MAADKQKQAAAVRRIQEMEAAFDRVSAAEAQLSAALDAYAAVQDDLKKLKRYYRKEWKLDFQADEAGTLPPDLKRGVLSEDGLWDLLEEHQENIRTMLTCTEPEEGSIQR